MTSEEYKVWHPDCTEEQYHQKLEQEFVQAAADLIAQAGAHGYEIQIWMDGSVSVHRLPEIYRV